MNPLRFRWRLAQPSVDPGSGEATNLGLPTAHQLRLTGRISIVGSTKGVAAGFLAFRRVGISQFILTPWHHIEEMVFFGEHVIPAIRRLEAAEA